LRPVVSDQAVIGRPGSGVCADIALFIASVFELGLTNCSNKRRLPCVSRLQANVMFLQ
jgi:hypothetical protein